MSNKILLHVGIHKTGSSSIQGSLYNLENYKKLCHQKFFYSRSPGENHSAFFHSAFSERPENYHSNKSAGRTLDEIKNRVEEVEESTRSELSGIQGSTICFSGEDACILSQESLMRFNDFLASVVPDVTETSVLIYTRNPVSYVESAIQENVKGNGLTLTKAKERHIEATNDRYSELYLKFIKVYGERQVHLRSFESAITNYGDVVVDFGEFAGLDLSEISISRKNAGVADEVVRVLSELNASGIELNRLDRDALLRLPGQKHSLLGADDIQRINSYAKNDINFLNDHGIFYDLSDFNDRVKSEVFSKDFIDALTKLSSKLNIEIFGAIDNLLKRDR